jgi:hypothetical protein
MPRNGLPPQDYAYRGDGTDTLTPQGVMIAWNRQLRAMGVNPGAASREELERLAEAEVRLASEHEADASPRAAARPGAARKARMPDPDAERHGCGYVTGSLGCRFTCGDGGR